MNKLKLFLEHKAYNMRLSSLLMTSIAGSGHPTSCLSAADVVSSLFFYAMKFDPTNFEHPDNDRFILSKGHASPILYAVYKELGLLTQEDLLTYRKIDSPLEGHPTLRFKYAEAATGSLGMGLSIGAGMALNAKQDDLDYYTYVLLGDSECAEGSIWEAAELAHHYKLNNLVVILDCNRLGQRGQTMHGHHVQRYADKFAAFGWKTITIDGHDMNQIMHAFDKAHDHVDQPTVIIAKTIKGYGTLAADKNGFHGKAFTKEELNSIFVDLEDQFPKAALFNIKKYEYKSFAFNDEKIYERPVAQCIEQIPESTYDYQTPEIVPTRKAFGAALAKLGNVCTQVVSLDAEVKNSTYSELFEKKHPNRFIECFIAEQNMVSMAVGLNRRGKIPFVSTFGAFFSRCFDQVRMAAVGSASLRLVGSHSGVSIGQDGPSQMALEDIALMRSIPNSVVLYPSDAVSTHALVGCMAKYSDGMSYLRTTRMATPVLYNPTTEFKIGGCAVLKQSEQDKVCIVAAGITVHQALAAYHQLKDQNITVAVIDAYSIKPLDVQTIIAVAQKSGNKIITVEDHYLEGGLGQAVAYAVRNNNITVECLAVTELPRSGKPEELLALMQIDVAAIVKKVKANF